MLGVGKALASTLPLQVCGDTSANPGGLDDAQAIYLYDDCRAFLRIRCDVVRAHAHRNVGGSCLFTKSGHVGADLASTILNFSL
jgi:hypothetical protein